MPPAEYHLIFRAPMPSPRCRGRRRCCVRVASVILSASFARRCLRCVLSVTHASSASSSSPSFSASAAAARILRITGIVVTVAPRRHRFARGGAQLVRPLLPTLAVIVASVRTRARSCARLVKLALPLLVPRSPNHPALGAAALATRHWQRISVFQDFVQRRGRGASASWRRHRLVFGRQR